MTTIGLWAHALLSAIVVYHGARANNQIWNELRCGLAVIATVAVWVIVDAAH
jgi:hypothetical protein